MRVQLLHLSGPRRGRTETFAEANVLIGTDPDATLRFRRGIGAAGRHAEIAFDECGCAFHIKAIGGEVFVNGSEVRELILLRKSATEILEVARSAGIKLMRDDCWTKVANGHTTVDEIVRVTKIDAASVSQ